LPRADISNAPDRTRLVNLADAGITDLDAAAMALRPADA
jgi:hypothetical protein